MSLTYYYFICKVLGGFVFSMLGELMRDFVFFLEVMCHVLWTRIRVKLELKDFIKIKEIKMYLFYARSI